MAEESFFVAVDGRQLDGEHDMGQVRQFCTQYAGRQVMVWNESLGSWTDPKTLPAFRVAAAPAPAPAPAPAAAPAPAPAPAPAAPAARPMHPAAASAAAAGVAVGLSAEETGALKGLLDFRFETFVGPKLIRMLYMVLVVLCGLGALGGIVSGLSAMATSLRFGSFFGIVTGVIMMVIGPVVAVFYLALMRTVLEGVQVLFQIREKLEKKG